MSKVIELLEMLHRIIHILAILWYGLEWYFVSERWWNCIFIFFIAYNFPKSVIEIRNVQKMWLLTKIPLNHRTSFEWLYQHTGILSWKHIVFIQVNVLTFTTPECVRHLIRLLSGVIWSIYALLWSWWTFLISHFLKNIFVEKNKISGKKVCKF